MDAPRATQVFGDPAFIAWEVAIETETSGNPSHTQVAVTLIVGGHRFDTNNDAVETAGVLLGKLERFSTSGPRRHWGPFHEDTSPQGVMDLVHAQIRIEEYAPKADELWTVFDRYCFGRVFSYHDLGLGSNGELVAVRTSKHEDLFWSINPGEPARHSQVPAQSFDRALSDVIEWLAARA